MPSSAASFSYNPFSSRLAVPSASHPTSPAPACSPSPLFLVVGGCPLGRANEKEVFLSSLLWFWERVNKIILSLTSSSLSKDCPAACPLPACSCFLVCRVCICAESIQCCGLAVQPLVCTLPLAGDKAEAVAKEANPALGGQEAGARSHRLPPGGALPPLPPPRRIPQGALGAPCSHLRKDDNVKEHRFLWGTCLSYTAALTPRALPARVAEILEAIAL